MSEELLLFEQAVEALTQALASTNPAERNVLLDKALRLHRLANAAAGLADRRPGSASDD